MRAALSTIHDLRDATKHLCAQPRHPAVERDREFLLPRVDRLLSDASSALADASSAFADASSTLADASSALADGDADAPACSATTRPPAQHVPTAAATNTRRRRVPAMVAGAPEHRQAKEATTARGVGVDVSWAHRIAMEMDLDVGASGSVLPSHTLVCSLIARGAVKA